MNLCMWYVIVMQSAFDLLLRLVIRVPTCFVWGLCQPSPSFVIAPVAYLTKRIGGSHPCRCFPNMAVIELQLTDQQWERARREDICPAILLEDPHALLEYPCKPVTSERDPRSSCCISRGASPRTTTTGPCRLCAWNTSQLTRVTRRAAAGCCSRCQRARRYQQR